MKKLIQCVMFGLTLICFLYFRVATGATYTVTNTGDNGGIDPPPGAGTGTLRQAMVDASFLTPGIADNIVFNILPGGLQTIQPLSQLPDLNDAAGVLIDGFTQPGGATAGANPPSTAVLLIEIDGSFCMPAPPVNTAHGFVIKSPNNTIRGLVIKKFRQNGIYIMVMPTGVFNNMVYCNYIGTDPTGALISGNGWDQSQLWAGVTIGSLGTGTAHNNTVSSNLISGNYAEGVSIMSCPTAVDVYSNLLMNNYIGTNRSGTGALGNVHDGVYIGEGAHNNTVNNNLISANGFEGVCIIGYPPNGWDSHSNTVSNNKIGLTVALQPLGNSSDGINIGIYGANLLPQYYHGGYSTRNTIGPNNRISANGRNGICVWEFNDGLNVNADKNRITRNFIYSNGLLGIDLGDNGVTINDPNDPDAGANQLENFPVITSAVLYNGQTTISGTLNIDANPANSLVELFKLNTIDPSGFGEGDIYLTQTTPAASGNWSVTVPGIATGGMISATATDLNSPNFNTSEFSAGVVVTTTVNYTVTTNPPGLSFYVDGISYTALTTFAWLPFTSHIIATTSPQPGSPGFQFVFNNWSDGGAISHTITTTLAPAAFVANFTSAPSGSTLHIVTNTGDNGGIDPLPGAGTGTLRQALVDANDATVPPGTPDTIVFNILPGGLQTIQPLSQLPSLTDPGGVLIDGFTQPGGATPGTNPPSTATLLIEIDGSQCQVLPPANTAHGFILQSTHNTIRGLIINRFRQNGIFIPVTQAGTSNNLVYCNFIGTDHTGNPNPINHGNGWDHGQLWAGVCMGSLGNGTVHHNIVEANLISSNYTEGVCIMSCPTLVDVFSNQVINNYIGTDISGLAPMGNIHDGVYIGEGAHHNLVDGNLISANGFEGVCIIGYPPNGWDTHSNTVSNNIIGLNISLLPLGNSSDGVGIGIYGANQVPQFYQGGWATRNTIGPGNVISNNSRNGVMVWELGDGLNANADKNRITQNSIYGNGRLGIDLGDNLVTLNDLNDPDMGPDQELNFPVITSVAVNAGQTTISGTLNINTNPANSVIEIFNVGSPDPSGYGEGDTYLTQTIPLVSGNWSVTFPGLVQGPFLSATTTDLNNNTSEFGMAFLAGTASVDFGDCPDPSYPTLLASNGASHIVNPAIRLGTLIDGEPDGLQSPMANGDDNQNDDEDGVLFSSGLVPGNAVNITVTASVAGQLNAWLDFNRDGDWTDPGEWIFMNAPMMPGANLLALAVPPNATPGPAFARFRFNLAGGLTFTGPATEGEVEDYQVVIGVISPTTQIDPDPALAWVQNEISMALLPGPLPGIPSALVAAYNDHPYPGGPGLGVSNSMDGGVTWIPQQLPFPPNPFSGGLFVNSLNPTATADAGGNLYVAHIANDNNWVSGPASGLFVHKSINGGITWSGPVPVATNGPAVASPDPNYRYNNRCQMTADISPLSPFLNNLYIVEAKNRGWNMPQPQSDIYFSSSTNGGATWSPQVILNGPQSNMANTPVSAVAPNGVIYVCWADYNFQTGGPATIYLDISTDGGLSWLANDIAVTVFVTPPIRLNGGTDVLVEGAPVIHTSPVNSQEVYIVFSISTLSSPGNPSETQIVFVKSTDGGLTWSQGILVNDNLRYDQVLPWMDVKPNGMIDVVWYDRRNDPNDLIWDVYMSTSTDGGISFNPNIQVNTLRAPSPLTPSGLWMGAYPGLVVDQTHAYIAYTMGTPDIKGDVYFNKVQNPCIDIDFGDLPDLPYQTLLARNGPSHIIGPLFLGNLIDAEVNGQPNLTSLGDDNNKTDDEDGIVFTGNLIPGQPVSIMVTASQGNGLFQGWIDYNADGDFIDTGEQVFSNLPLPAGGSLLSFVADPGAVPGTTFARFRISSVFNLSYTGAAPDGEVEDYQVTISYNKDFGDAPENAIAYPSQGVTGAFPTCISTLNAGWIEHTNSGAFFGPSVDFEADGNAGFCPTFLASNYNQDECFNDGDAGLLIPTPFTITGNPPNMTVTPCGGLPYIPLGNACKWAHWGTGIDIHAQNQTPGLSLAYVNVQMDWNHDGQWAGASVCPGGAAVPEHVLVNFPVPAFFSGPIGALGPPAFLMGPDSGYVWTRFSITDQPVALPWDGSGSFTDGETEDYLLLTIPGDTIPDSLLVQNITIPYGIDTCFEAVNKITVAGNSTTFTVQNGGEVHLIASQMVLFLPGASVQNGGKLHAYITTDGTYCNNMKSDVAFVEGMSDAEQQDADLATGKSFFKVYPNPTTGDMTLELASLPGTSITIVEIYSILGEKILSKSFPSQSKYEISLALQPPGVYIIRVITGKEVGAVKVIRQ